MNCVKCGREIPEDQVFCEHCLAEMERYPVNPDTAIHIPTRPQEEEIVKKPVKRKHIPTAEELLLKTRKKLRRNRIAVVMLLLICGVLSFVVGQMVLELDFQRLVGQNYKFAGLRPGGNKENSFTVISPEVTELATEAEPVAFVVEEAEEVQTAIPEEEPVEPATEAPTAAPTEAPAEAPTEAPTEAATEPATEVPTEAPTEEDVDVTEPEAPATEAAATETPAEESVESASEEVTEEPAV